MDQVGVFAKYWTPGEVKTRLASSIGCETAARLYREFLAITVSQLTTLDGVQPALVISPPERAGEFQQLVTSRWLLQTQRGGDLGERMRNYFADAFAQGARRVVLIGSDTPHLPVQYLLEAFAALERVPIVLGPTDDGGYYLIGMRDKLFDLFEDIPWSTSRVWQETVNQLAQRNIAWHELPPSYDVDNLADLQRLANNVSHNCRLGQVVHAALGGRVT